MGPEGSTAATNCLCDVGYTGSGSCSECPADTFKGDTGTASCIACPGDSASPSGSIAASACKCNAGFSGEVTGVDTASGSCSACPAHTYKLYSGSEVCAACPDYSGTYDADGSELTTRTLASQCLCKAGFEGTLLAKRAVVNGPEAGPCYAYLHKVGMGNVGWNFDGKFLVSRTGDVTFPTQPEADIAALL